MEEPGRLQSMGSEESDTTEQLHFHFSLSCIGEGNGNPLQCSCLENPRDGGAWWATVYGVAQSQTGLKWLSSSSSRIIKYFSLKVDLWRKENFRRIWTSLHFLQNKWNSVFFVFFKSQLLFILLMFPQPMFSVQHAGDKMETAETGLKSPTQAVY